MNSESQQAHRVPCHRLGPMLPVAAPDPHQSGMLAQVLDEIDHGLLLVDLTARVVHLNLQARRELASARILRNVDGMLKGADAETDLSIARALRDAERDCRSIVELDGEGDPLALAFIPLAPWPGAAVDTVLIMCSRRKSCAKLTLRMFARSKQLTHAEAGVLEQLCAGRAAQDIAALQGLRVSTVRTHIKHVRQKAGASSVREVVRRVACMPQVASALRLVSHKQTS